MRQAGENVREEGGQDNGVEEMEHLRDRPLWRDTGGRREHSLRCMKFTRCISQVLSNEPEWMWTR